MFNSRLKNKKKANKIDTLDTVLDVGELVVEAAADTAGGAAEDGFDLLDCIGDADDIQALAILGVLAAVVGVGAGIVKLIRDINKRF